MKMEQMELWKPPRYFRGAGTETTVAVGIDSDMIFVVCVLVKRGVILLTD